jgi:hypothetical protein
VPSENPVSCESPAEISVHLKCIHVDASVKPVAANSIDGGTVYA